MQQITALASTLVAIVLGSLGPLAARVAAPGPEAAFATAGAVMAGNIHTCAVAPGGEVRCWGYDGSGPVGDGTTTDRLLPVVVQT